MATKNLARTAIEGGRIGSNKWDRRYSHKETRSDQKSYLHDVSKDIENYYEYDIEETRHVRKEFNDKLNPMYRWLESQIGEPWDEVHSKAIKEFDTNTTAGRHIVYDHLFSSVEIVPDPYRLKYYRQTDNPFTSYSQHDFYVDDNGILCKRQYISYKKQYKIPHFNTCQLVNWLNGRVVGKVGKKLFWFIPADTNKKGGYPHQWKAVWGRKTYYQKYDLQFHFLKEKIIYKRDNVGNYILIDGKPIISSCEKEWVYGYPNFRQGRKLDNKDLAFWNTMPEWYQTRVLEQSPTYPKDLKNNNCAY